MADSNPTRCAATFWLAPRLVEFQRRWESIIREWSLRWGQDVSGWWIDGCYFPDQMYRFDDEPNFASFAAALKAGNPQAIVAFNPGVKVPVVVRLEGTNVEEGKQLLRDSGMAIIPADNINDGAKKVVEAVKAAA